MITEDYVSYETAKLLKEKGFDAECIGCYYKGELDIFDLPANYNTGNSGNTLSAPTLQMAMKWLRETHNLAIDTFVTVDGWRSFVSKIKLDSKGFVVDIIGGIDNGNIPNCDTYEQACEAAIKYCLENLI